MEILQRSLYLIESAHKILLKAQKASPVQDSQNRSALKTLRKALNEGKAYSTIFTLKVL